MNIFHLRIISLLFVYAYYPVLGGVCIHAGFHSICWAQGFSGSEQDGNLATSDVIPGMEKIPPFKTVFNSKGLRSTVQNSGRNCTDTAIPAHLPHKQEFSDPSDLVPVMPDTVHLDEIRVEATRLYLPDRHHAVRIYRADSTLIQRYGGSSLAGLIEYELPAMVRNYGPSGISSISVRGFGPGQTQILWEGIPVNHPMVGQTDLALYPSSAFTSIEYVPGNSASAYGSGSIGGTLHLGSGSASSEAAVSRSYGDFGMKRTGIMVTEVSGPLAISMSASGLTADNDYRYYDRNRQRDARRENADKQAFSITGKASYEKGRWNAGSALWIGNSKGGVPGSVVAGRTLARQDDQWLRWGLNAGFRSGTTRYYTHTYFSRHNLDYIDERSRIDSRSSSNSGGLTAGLTSYINSRITLNALMQAGRQWIDTNNYDQVESRTFGAVSLSGIVELPAGLRLFPGLRVDSYSDFGWAFSPSLGMNLELLGRLLVLRAQYSNDFNAPNMNDLFWTPGGNPDLRPERGINLEGGASVEWEYGSYLRVALDATVYRTSFRDGIVWSPVSGSIWSPANLQGLEAEGIELNQEITLRYNGFSLDISGSWLKSLISSNTPRYDGDPATGLQRPYIPEQILKGTIALRHRYFSVYANRVHTGERFTTADHSSPLDPLDPYTVINAGMSVTAGLGNFYSTVRLNVMNLTGERYEVIAWYPMPDRHSEISVTIGYRP